jgi:hypothetical protein
MTDEIGRAGREAEQRGRIAERSFLDRVDWWLATCDGPQAAQIVPDVQKVDYRIVIPSLWSQADNFISSWQIKATNRPVIVENSPLGCRCLRYKVRTHDLVQLYEFSRADSPLFLALAVQSDSRQSPTDLLTLPPAERFNWFVLQLNQYFDHFDWRAHPEYIYIPLQNQLNLATFALIWSAHWVHNFFGMLARPELYGAPGLRKIVPHLFDKSGSLALIADHGWNFLLTELPKFQGEIDTPMFKAVNFRLGLAGALGVIRRQMYDAAGNIDVVRNYCPESLYGTANLWLFATCYDYFMRTTSDIGSGSTDFVSQRLLPLPAEHLRDMPRILLSILWNVVVRYRTMGTKVALIPRPAVDAGEDYSYYGGGIGYFPWITLDQNQANWVIESKGERTPQDSLEFIDHHSHMVQLGSAHNNRDAAHFFHVPPRELDLPSLCPMFLFPQESIFLRYPRELFVPTGRPAII